MGKKLKINKYNGKKGEYLITYIYGKPYFVINKSNANLIARVNLKTEKPYFLYIGDYKQINDLILI